MHLRLDPRRFTLGLHGLALLRGWPFGDADEAAGRLREMSSLLERDVDAEELIDATGVDLDAAYEAWATTYDELSNALIEHEEPALRAIVERFAPGDALDAACGTGRVAAMLVERGHRVVGVDTSPAMLAKAGAKQLEVDLRTGALDHLPLADDSVDLAVCALALTHAEDLTGPMGELARVTRPNGVVVVSDVHPFAVATGAHAGFRRDDGERMVTRNHVHWHGAYVRAASAAGLTVDDCQEVLVGESFITELRDVATRGPARDGLLGLPLVLLWVFRKGPARPAR